MSIHLLFDYRTRGMSENEAAACLAIFLLLDDDDEKRKLQEIGYGKEKRKGCIQILFKNLGLRIQRPTKEMMRMNYESFKEILAFIEPHITPKQSGVMGAQSISPAERLVLTIRFLATGKTFCSLSLQFRVTERTISYIVEEVTKAIAEYIGCLLYTSRSPRDKRQSRMPSSA